MEENKERIAIFIDGSNLYHILKKIYGYDKQLKFDFQRFCNYISKEGELVGIYYYNSPLDRKKNLEKYRNQQRFFEQLKKIPRLNLILCRMQKLEIDRKIIYLVKEDDIHLAVDMVKFAYKDVYDSAILVSSDGDFVPAVKAVIEIGKNVKNIGFETKFSYHLKQECSKFIKIKRDEIEEFLVD